MKPFDVVLPPELIEKLEKARNSPTSVFTPEIDAILLQYGGKKVLREIGNVIYEYYGIRIPERTLRYRLKQLQEKLP